MLPLTRPLLDQVAIGAAGGALLALLVALWAHLRIRKVRRQWSVLEGADGPQSVLEAIADMQAETAALRHELARTRQETAAAREDLADALRHVAVVRYDAFGDLGGRMSFTAALLDDSGDGLVITTINGRSESRSYAKGVKGSQSEATLSPEEAQAIELAMHGHPASARTSGSG